VRLFGTFKENVDRSCSKTVSAFKEGRATVQRRARLAFTVRIVRKNKYKIRIRQGTV
jgi:hypothetical protein